MMVAIEPDDCEKRDPVSHGFFPDDFQNVYALMKRYIALGDEVSLRAVMSNNHNIILAALIVAAGEDACP